MGKGISLQGRKFERNVFSRRDTASFSFFFFSFRVLGVAVERLKRVELNKLRSFSSRLVENSVN